MLARQQISNPLVMNFTRRHKFSVIRLPLIFLLATLILIVSIHFVLRESQWLTLLMLISGLLLLIAPPLTAGVAASHTVRRVTEREYELLVLTTLTNRTLARGHLWAALAKMQSVMGLTIGLVPALIVGFVATYIEARRFYDYSYGQMLDPVYKEVETNGPTIVAVGLAIGLVGMNWLGASLGVGLGLWWRNRLATVMAISTLCMCQLAATMGIVYLVLGIQTTDFQAVTLTPTPSLVMLTLTLMLLPFAAAAIFMRFAERHAR